MTHFLPKLGTWTGGSVRGGMETQPRWWHDAKWLGSAGPRVSRCSHRAALGSLGPSQRPFSPRANQHPERDCQRAPLICSLSASWVLFQLLSTEQMSPEGSRVPAHLHGGKGQVSARGKRCKEQGLGEGLCFLPPRTGEKQSQRAEKPGRR